jgi:hypothetical protein
VLNDAPNWLATTAARSYAASLWVRADGAGAGATLKLKLRGGIELKSRAKAFRGGSMLSWFGGIGVDPATPNSRRGAALRRQALRRRGD